MKIPKMTHRLSRYWDQPDPEDIEIDETHALMSPEDFCKLADYSLSQPSGVYPGKMWKRNAGNDWTLCWYSESHDPEYCNNNYRTILLT